MCLETSVILMDDEEFKSSFCQRVFQYIRIHSDRASLDDFSYIKDTVEGNKEDCLRSLLGSV